MEILQNSFHRESCNTEENCSTKILLALSSNFDLPKFCANGFSKIQFKTLLKGLKFHEIKTNRPIRTISAISDILCSFVEVLHLIMLLASLVAKVKFGLNDCIWQNAISSWVNEYCSL